MLLPLQKFLLFFLDLHLPRESYFLVLNLKIHGHHIGINIFNQATTREKPWKIWDITCSLEYWYSWIAYCVGLPIICSYLLIMWEGNISGEWWIEIMNLTKHTNVSLVNYFSYISVFSSHNHNDPTSIKTQFYGDSDWLVFLLLKNLRNYWPFH